MSPLLTHCILSSGFKEPGKDTLRLGVNAPENRGSSHVFVRAPGGRGLGKLMDFSLWKGKGKYRPHFRVLDVERAVMKIAHENDV